MRHRFKRRFTARRFTARSVALGFGALLLTAASVAHAATRPEASAMQGAVAPPSVIALNQKLEDGSVAVEYAFLPVKGYAVIYGADEDGKPIREPLGHVELAAGDHRKFKIKLDKAPPEGARLWVSLYTDKDDKPGFDRRGDVAVWQDRLPAENHIVVQ